MPGDRMVGGHFNHRAHQRGGGERIVRRQLDDGVRPGKRVADHRQDADNGRVAGDHVDAARAERAGARGQAGDRARSLIDPAFEIVHAAATLDHRAHSGAAEHRPEPRVVEVQDAFRQAGRDTRQAKCLADVRVRVEIEPLPQLDQIIQNVLEAECIEVRHVRRRAQGQLADVPGDVRGTEVHTAAPAPMLHSGIVYDFAADDQWDAEFVWHRHPPYIDSSARNSSARSCASGAPAQTMRSSPPSASL